MAFPGGGDDPIEELSVQLTATGADFLDEIDDDIGQVEEKLEGFAKIWADMTDEIREKAVELGKEVKINMELLGVSFEKAVDNVLRSSFAIGEGFDRLDITLFAIQVEKERIALEEEANKLGAIAQLIKKNFETIEKAFKDTKLEFTDELKEEVLGTLTAIGDESETVEEAAQRMDEFTTSVKDNAAAQSQLDNILGRLLNKFGKTAIALTALSAVSKFLREGIELAVTYSASMTRLEIAVRAYQLTQGEAAGSIDDWREFASQITEKFGGELEQTYANITAEVLLMSRSLNLNKDEIQGVIEAGIILDRVNGDIEGSSRRIADFIRTGHSDALENLGIDYNDALFQQTAFELGIRKTKDEMTEAEQQIVRYNLVVEQTVDLTEDAAAVQESLAGRIEDADVAVDEAAGRVGKIFLPAWAFMNESFAKTIELLTVLIQNLGVGLIIAFSAAIASGAAFAQAIIEVANQIESGLFDAEKILTTFGQTFDQELAALVESGVARMLGDIEGLGDGFGKPADDAEDMALRISEAFQSATEAIEEATKKWAEGLAKAQQKLSDRLDDIARRTTRRRQDLETDLVRDLRDIEIKGARDREDAIREAMLDELRLREDFQRDIRDLEARFLLDLEDAVRDRDARRVLSLQRRFNLEKRKREEDFKLREKRDKENLALELLELEENLQFKRARRLLAFQEQLADLALQNVRRQQDARVSFQRELRDLQTNITRRLQLVAAGWAAQLNLNQAGLQALFNQLNTAYGPGGFVEAFFARFAQITVMSTLQRISGLFGGLGGLGLPTGIPRRQRGAIGMVASSPTLMLVGERPEIINVTPFSTSTGAPIAGFGRTGGRTQIGLEVGMEDGLVGRIVDQSLDEMADVVVNIKKVGG